MSDLVKRLNKAYEDRDLGDFTPAICKEAANRIAALEKENEALKKLFDEYFTDLNPPDWIEVDQYLVDAVNAVNAVISSK